MLVVVLVVELVDGLKVQLHRLWHEQLVHVRHREGAGLAALGPTEHIARGVLHALREISDAPVARSAKHQVGLRVVDVGNALQAGVLCLEVLHVRLTG